MALIFTGLGLALGFLLRHLIHRSQDDLKKYVEAKFKGIESRQANQESHIDKADTKIESQHERLLRLTALIDRLEDRIEKMRDKR